MIEQGDLQVWGHYRDLTDSHRLLPDEVYALLQDAGVDASELRLADEQRDRLTSRALRSLLGSDKNLPPYLDLSEMDEPALRHLPSVGS